MPVVKSTAHRIKFFLPVLFIISSSDPIGCHIYEGPKDQATGVASDNSDLLSRSVKKTSNRFMGIRILDLLSSNEYESLRSSKLWGMFLMALSGVLMTLSNFFVQLAIEANKRRIPTLEIVFVRSVIQLIMVIPPMMYHRVHPIENRENIVVLTIMGICGFLSVTFIYLGIDKVPLADATIITFTSPVFTSMFAYVVISESCSVWDAVCGLISFVGVIIVSRPSFIFGESYGHGTVIFHSGRIPQDMREKLYLMGIGFVLLGALFLSLYFVLTRKVGTSMHYLLNIFYPSLLGSIFIPIMMLPWYSLMLPGCWKARLYILLVGIMGFGGLNLLALSLKLESAGPLVLVRNLDIIYAFLLQYMVLGIRPTLWSLGGGVVVIAATTVLLTRRWMAMKKERGLTEEKEEERAPLTEVQNND